MAQEDNKNKVEEKNEEYKELKGKGFFKKVKYSVFNIEPEPYYLYDNPVSKDIILNKYRLKNETVEKVKEKLYTEHKKFFEEYFINN